MSSLHKIKRAVTATWTALGEVLEDGQLGYDRTKKLLKVGDGSTPWDSLQAPIAPLVVARNASVVTTSASEVNLLGSSYDIPVAGRAIGDLYVVRGAGVFTNGTGEAQTGTIRVKVVQGATTFQSLPVIAIPITTGTLFSQHVSFESWISVLTSTTVFASSSLKWTVAADNTVTGDEIHTGTSDALSADSAWSITPTVQMSASSASLGFNGNIYVMRAGLAF